MRFKGRLCETGERVTVETRAGRIASIQPHAAAAADLDGDDLWLAPGFIDLQLNGYAGHDFNLDSWGDSVSISHDLAPIFAAAAAAGTALLCPTIVTNSFECMAASLRALAVAGEQDAALARRVAGIHVEGPHIAREDGPRGAHPLEWVREPDWDEFQRLQEAAGGRIKLFSLAPELPGALPFIARLTEAGVVVSIAHTAAEPETIRDAVLAGARLSTHLGNGAHAMIRRHPNYIWEQLAHDDLCASVIADGHHLPASVLKTFVRAKGPERLCLVSDAVSLGGLSPGIYSEGRHEVLANGKVCLAGTPLLAGAGHLLDTGVAHAVRVTDLTLAQAVRSVTAIPARLLGLSDRKGRLAVGCDADLTLFRLPAEGPLEIAATVVAGEVVFRGAQA